mmetsp:Transcript_30147/g.36844  ORF Transcript_30147/g.36844 Transcript_30147/m.36844 type:complete len:786 (-) Transcript_30147:57-2414(-)|eukprot:CAMPEP_0172513170 /NCGR_PEP_ID=MMETSP1066-20121228/250264_1 /TAXON_ID=671091 /ORGANISM="Coscinodiscus wailesii, Strain CCMP2513" /LENGTH=785 /DNA_ID=CAMNT_0013293317 /DNA_START=45 /DNA_END=2402 /DNA_ORIENTATION=+
MAVDTQIPFHAIRDESCSSSLTKPPSKASKYRKMLSTIAILLSTVGVTYYFHTRTARSRPPSPAARPRFFSRRLQAEDASPGVQAYPPGTQAEGASPGVQAHPPGAVDEMNVPTEDEEPIVMGGLQEIFPDEEIAVPPVVGDGVVIHEPPPQPALGDDPPPPPLEQQQQRHGGSSTWPEVAWLMSFPDSGTGYITRVVQGLSQTCMATNYGPELGQSYASLPSISRSESGPYRYNDRPFPPRFILTKTFCMGFCLSCEAMFSQTSVDFYRGCSLGNRILDGIKPNMIRYNEADGKRVVHLFRDPFDNIVLRFQLESQKYQNNPGGYDMSTNGEIWNFQFNPEGFKRWCQDVDAVAREMEPLLKDPIIANLVENVPCYGQFYQYVHWHNKAFDVVAEYRVPHVIVHYDEFQVDMEGAINKLFNFLELPISGSIPPFQEEHFQEFYTMEERTAISSYLKVLASQPTWLQLKGYMPAPDLQTSFAPVGASLSPYYGNWPELVWLISYPNSGTYFTTQLVQVGSQTTTATNYLPETGDRYLDIPNYAFSEHGPFRTSKRLLPSKYVLTKTHCSGHNYEANPDNILTTHLEFMKGCGTAITIKHGGRKSVRYKATEVKKVVHLLRNPFDNVVARFHYLYKRYNSENNRDWNYSHNPAGFKEYCAELDAEFEGMRITTFGAEISILARRIPCHGEFYQYVQWHNNAFRLARMLNIPELVLLYEDYRENMNQQVAQLFGFLEVTVTGFVTPFQWNGGYERYFTAADREKIKLFIMAMCEDKTCEIMKQYLGE